jgi:DNA-binding MarR family transcriptional regulator
MPFDSLITNPGRLRILTSLASADDRQPFVEVRRRTGLTDGNLATHARRLQSAGLIAIEKSIAEGKPLTTLYLTRAGRDALAQHAHELLAALQENHAAAPANEFSPAMSSSAEDSADDDWVD